MLRHGCGLPNHPHPTAETCGDRRRSPDLLGDRLCEDRDLLGDRLCGDLRGVHAWNARSGEVGRRKWVQADVIEARIEARCDRSVEKTAITGHAPSSLR